MRWPTNSRRCARSGALLSAVTGFAVSAAAGGSTGDAAPVNIVVVVMDTARPDHFSTYGYPRDTTPHFGALAEDAILFERAYSTSCWTVPSHASLFTGLYPMAHGATQERRTLDDELVTVAELLRDAGYETAAWSGNPWVSNKTNLMQGFERAETQWDRPERAGEGPHPTNRRVAEWLDARDPGRPFFLFVNYIEPHWPYRAPAEVEARFLPPGVEVGAKHPARFPITRWYLKRDRIPDGAIALRRDTYDAELAWTDAILDDLLGRLDARDLLAASLVVVTSDHGESHGEHGHVGHSFQLYDSVVRVPLLVKPPAWEGGAVRRADPVQLVDLFPTILGAAGLGGVASREDAWDVLDGTVPEDRPLIAEYYYPDQVLGFFPEGAEEDEAIAPYLRRLRSIQVGGDKLVWGSDGRNELYDVASDAGETDNLVAKEPDRARDLEARLDDFVARHARETEAVATDSLDEETREQLRSLGYLR